ncbi:MAG: hypothetical protein FJW88_05630 [Actinobacteria bacterium]|nr:hypothetical protein [Actinomycetota bacterium]
MKRVFLGALLGAALLVALAGPAGAHGDDGNLAVQATRHGLSVEYVTRLTFVSDGHPADEATVTVSATGPATVAPVALSPQGDGNYAGTVTFPTVGTWTVVLESTNPGARVTQTQVVADDAPTTTTTSPSSRTASRGSGAGTEDETGGDSALPVIAFVVVGVFAGLGIGFWLVRRNAARRG